ncbi:hypothetical protein DU508_00915 [Pedobacter chinensis]|uniref:Uncharacterized protein n=1 Tax=Pedobacter chinensis TaxID=2282421 RepID=A0A369Q0Y3_9SPHI|nr:hypothetical protein [Pedobacter chinensis]RDC58591.1 hypothetical protein DU508_00915 [Pedobacter chinensis]
MNNSIPEKNIIWHHQLCSALAELKIECHFFWFNDFELLKLVDHDFTIHLVNLNHHFCPEDLTKLQGEYTAKGPKLIHLWEDVWITRSKQVLGRIASLLGLNNRIHGRKTTIQKITKPIAQSFLNENHLQGYVSSRYKLGLFDKEQLVAVATFSALRKMNYEENYKSAELIRFAVKTGYSVTGGLSKLISHFSEQYKPDDLMTYADRDWSTGGAYVKLGFINTDSLPPQYFCLDEHFNRSLIKENHFPRKTVFNTGSLKYILKF